MLYAKVCKEWPFPFMICMMFLLLHTLLVSCGDTHVFLYTVPSSGNLTNARVGHASDTHGTHEGHTGDTRVVQYEC